MMTRAALLFLLTASYSLVAGCADDDEMAVAPDVAISGKCGTWVRANFREMPPASATAYGMEYNPMGTFSQYVCRFRVMLDGKEMVLQGKGVFGYSCYAILPAGMESVAQVEPSADFEVLTNSACASMVPFREDQSNGSWLQTGTDTAGNPTYSCHGVVKSLEGGSQETSFPLGRYEPETKRCVFEWYNSVRAAPAPGSTESFEMLVVP